MMFVSVFSSLVFARGRMSSVGFGGLMLGRFAGVPAAGRGAGVDGRAGGFDSGAGREDCGAGRDESGAGLDEAGPGLDDAGAGGTFEGGGIDAGGSGGGFDGVGGGTAATADAFGVTGGGACDGGGMLGVVSSAAAFASSRARESFSASDAASAARRNHLSASTRSPRAYDVAAVESAHETSSGSSSRTCGMGVVLIVTRLFDRRALRQTAFGALGTAATAPAGALRERLEPGAAVERRAAAALDHDELGVLVR